MIKMNTSPGSAKRCAVPSCRVTNPSKWGVGPDGPNTLCVRCYNQYRDCELDIFQDMNTKKLSVAPSWFSCQVNHTGFHPKGGSGRRMNIARPIVEALSDTNRSHSHERTRPNSASKERVKQRGSGSTHQGGGAGRCLVEGCGKVAVATGPDGSATLCRSCSLKYADRELVLYQAPHGTVSVMKRAGWRRVGVLKFVRGRDGKFDRCRPLVESWGTDGGHDWANDAGGNGGPVASKDARKRKRREETAQDKSAGGDVKHRKRVKTDAAEANVNSAKAGFSERKLSTHVLTDGGWARSEGEDSKQVRVDVIQHRGQDMCAQARQKDGKIIFVMYNGHQRKLRLRNLFFSNLRKTLCMIFGLNGRDIKISYLDEDNRRTWIQSDEDVEELSYAMSLTTNRLMTLDVEELRHHPVPQKHRERLHRQHNDRQLWQSHGAISL